MTNKDIENEKDEKLKKTKKAIMQARETLEEISRDEHERYLAHLRDKHIRDQQAIQEYGYNKGVEAGEAKGKAEGILENSKEIAKKMLEDNCDIEFIIKMTGLTKEQIEKLF